MMLISLYIPIPFFLLFLLHLIKRPIWFKPFLKTLKRSFLRRFSNIVNINWWPHTVHAYALQGSKGLKSYSKSSHSVFSVQPTFSSSISALMTSRISKPESLSSERNIAKRCEVSHAIMKGVHWSPPKWSCKKPIPPALLPRVRKTDRYVDVSCWNRPKSVIHLSSTVRTQRLLQ